MSILGPRPHNITRVVGDLAEWDMTIRDPETQAPVDITGWTIEIEIEGLVTITASIVDAATGLARFSPTLEQVTQEPGRYPFRVKATPPSGKVATIAVGEFRFTDAFGRVPFVPLSYQ